jgi:alkylresorcinol/alkylpyrone synthase
MIKVHFAGLSTAVPPYILEKGFVAQEAKRIFARFGDEYTRLASVFDNAGINKRHSICPVEWFENAGGWADRSERFLDGAKDLFRKTAGEALTKAGVNAADIDVIVTVSSTGIATPSVEAHVMHEMGFQDTVLRVPVFGLGCAGGVTGLAIAHRMAAAKPGSKVLLVVIELCTLAFRPDEMTKSNVIATALFGDGAAALVVSSDLDGPQIEFAGQHTWNKTIDIMGWRIDDVGLSAIFARSIPDLVNTDLKPAIDGFLSSNGLKQSDLDSYSFHPGGVKVIQALENILELQSESLKNERDVLADYGNMSSPTVLFVLQKALAQKTKGRRFVGSLGPGFSASFMTILQ